MKTRFAVGLILLGLLVGCSKTITGPDNALRQAPTPVVSPAPTPVPTPGRCHPISACGDDR
jgi:hypothetical protein